MLQTLKIEAIWLHRKAYLPTSPSTVSSSWAPWLSTTSPQLYCSRLYVFHSLLSSCLPVCWQRTMASSHGRAVCYSQTHPAGDVLHSLLTKLHAASRVHCSWSDVEEREPEFLIRRSQFKPSTQWTGQDCSHSLAVDQSLHQEGTGCKDNMPILKGHLLSFVA